MNDSVTEKKASIFKKYGKETVLSFLSILALVSFLIYTSYALFTDLEIAPTANVISVGTLEITYDDTSTGLGQYIDLTDVQPMSDENGILLTPYKFKITNDGDIPALASVSIQDDTGAITSCGCGEDLLSHDYIKVYLVRESDGFVVGPSALSSFEYIDRVELAPQASETFSIRIWIDDKITLENYADKHFHGRVVIDATQKTTVYDYSYIGEYQLFTAPYTGSYQIETWGASGGKGHANGVETTRYGKGGFSSGKINLTAGDKLYVYVGGQGGTATDLACIEAVLGANTDTGGLAGWNGGGRGGNDGCTPTNAADDAGGGGGGATDIRYFGATTPTTAQLAWNSSLGLNSRIMVAGGGGGSSWDSATYNAGSGGGLIGESAAMYGSETDANVGAGGTQLTGHAFGQGANGIFTTSSNVGDGGGGGGYYGAIGHTTTSAYGTAGGGGSSYVSGHTGSIAIDITTDDDNEPRTPRTGTGGATCTSETTDNLCSVHYSEKVFTDTLMIDGNGYLWTNTRQSLMIMPNPAGGFYASGAGRIGNGYARITYLGL